MWLIDLLRKRAGCGPRLWSRVNRLRHRSAPHVAGADRPVMHLRQLRFDRWRIGRVDRLPSWAQPPEDRWSAFPDRRLANPFVRISRARIDHRLLVGLHSEGLLAPAADETFATELLCQRGKEAGIVVFVSDLHPRPAGEVIAYELKISPDSNASAIVRRTAEEYTSYAILGANQAPVLARTHLGEEKLASAVVELMALHDMGAHVIVTTNEAILNHRDDGWLTDLNVVTPAEALVLAGLWSRAIGNVELAPPEPPTLWLYYWGLARATTPASWPAFTAWLEGERTLPDGRLLFDLAGSVLERMSTNMRTLDRLVLLWLQPVSNASELEISAEMDNLLLRTWAIQDNLALLSGKHLEVKLKNDMSWSLLNPEWLRAVRAQGSLGERIADLAESMSDRLRIAQEFRHHAAHRVMLRPIVSSKTSEPDRMRISVPGEIADQITSHLARLGESGDDWGMGEEVPESTGPATVHKADGSVEEHLETFPRTVFLDPIPFAVRLVASTSLVVNRFFEVIDPATDSRLSEAQLRLIAMNTPPDWVVGQRAYEIVTTSPLAGLAPWVTS